MKVDITIRQLQAFIAVLERGSFSEAAQSMHLSQAALSGLVKELETRLGVRLFNRSTRRVEVSEVGASFEPQVRRALAALEEAVESVVNLRELHRGVVRVAAPETLSCTLLPRLISSYSERYPGVDVRFEDVPIEEVVARLANGSADIGFGPAAVPVDDTIEVQPFFVDALWAALRPDDPLVRQGSLTWKALQERPLINYMPNLAANVLSNIPSRFHPRQIMPVHRVNTALSMVQVKSGYVLCPSMARSLAEGFGLVFMPIRQPTVTWQVAVFSRTRESLSPAVESFLDFTFGMGQKWQGMAQST
ncbi:MAG TPA: LysR family transcriptional regulator [Burkholderiaceae bacterium]|nr:LysR family transcriptional regulator [Burkholderiaceae bacterium]